MLGIWNIAKVTVIPRKKSTEGRILKTSRHIPNVVTSSKNSICKPMSRSRLGSDKRKALMPLDFDCTTQCFGNFYCYHILIHFGVGLFIFATCFTIQRICERRNNTKSNSYHSKCFD